MNPTVPKKIAVIGAGPAGLTAAWRLQQAGFDCIVFEAQSQVGGRSRSIVESGAVFDLGAWTFTVGGAVHQLAEEAGLKNELVEIPTTLGRPKAGKLRTGDFRRSLSLIGLFSPSEALAAKRVLRMARTLPGKTPDETAAEWASRSFSPAFIQSILTPFAGMFFLQELNTLSRDALLSTMGYLSDIRLCSFRDGMGSLTRFLSKQIKVQTDARIESVIFSPKGVQLVGTNADSAADGLVIATPLPEVIKLLDPYISQEMKTAAEKWRYAPAIAVHLLLEKRWPDAVLQVLPPGKQKSICCGMAMERVKHPGRTPKECEAVTLYAAPEVVPDFMEKPDDAVVQLLAGELQQWLKIPRSAIIHHRVQRWSHGAAFCDVGVPERLTTLKRGFEELARKHPVWAAGDFLGSSGLEGTVKSAGQAADACKAFLV